jgi:hypothetical protein
MHNLVDYIRPDCCIVLPNQETVYPEEINTYKNFYKKEIYEKLQGKTVGKVALIWSNNLDVILPAIKAIWELGLSISVHDFTLDVVTHPAFKNFYKHIDIIIGPPMANHVLENLPHINALEIKMDYLAYAQNLKPNKIFMLDPAEYPDVEYNLDKPIDHNTICCVTHTSGTTGHPKIIGTTHQNAINLVKENIKLFDFSNQDLVLHYKTLHHGSLFLNYAIPAFVTTNHHRWVIQKENEDIVQFVDSCMSICCNEKITKWLPANSNIKTMAGNQVKSYDLSHSDIITVAGPSSADMKNIFKKHNPKTVYNNFGCTEIGTIAISKTCISTLDNYQPNKFNIFNELVDLEILPNFFKAKFKNDMEWKNIGDIVTMKDGEFIWHGRNTFLIFKDRQIKTSEIDNWLKGYLNSSAYSLVIFESFQRNAHRDAKQSRKRRRPLCAAYCSTGGRTIPSCGERKRGAAGTCPADNVRIYALRFRRSLLQEVLSTF